MSENDTDRQSEIAHQLRTPLTGIKMRLDIIHEQKLGALNEKQSQLVNQARGECQKLTELIDSFLSR